jgi:HK97 family phage major capsid protein
MLARPIAEWSTMNAGTAVGQKLAIYGDYQSYLIAERLGMTVEVVPHVLGSNRRPIGARGLYAYGRTGGSAIVPNAFRYLELS